MPRDYYHSLKKKVEEIEEHTTAIVNLFNESDSWDDIYPLHDRATPLFRASAALLHQLSVAKEEYEGHG